MVHPVLPVFLVLSVFMTFGVEGRRRNKEQISEQLQTFTDAFRSEKWEHFSGLEEQCNCTRDIFEKLHGQHCMSSFSTARTNKDTCVEACLSEYTTEEQLQDLTNNIAVVVDCVDGCMKTAKDECKAIIEEETDATVPDDSVVDQFCKMELCDGCSEGCGKQRGHGHHHQKGHGGFSELAGFFERMMGRRGRGVAVKGKGELAPGGLMEDNESELLPIREKRSPDPWGKPRWGSIQRGSRNRSSGRRTTTDIERAKNAITGMLPCNPCECVMEATIWNCFSTTTEP